MSPLNHAQLLQHLQDSLGWMLSKQRDLVPIAASLAQHPQQTWVLEWVQILIPQNVEITYQFLSHAAAALQLMNEEGVEAWLRDAITCFETQGLNAAITHLQTVAAYAAEYKKQNQGITLASVQRVLQTFLTALGGRNLNIAPAEEAYTDTETLYLPVALHVFPTDHDNFLLYKAIVAHLWGQNHFGTWSLDFERVDFPKTAHAWAMFHLLERLRLDAGLAREFAGLERTIQQLTENLGETRIPEAWKEIAATLATPQATVHDSYRLLNHVLNKTVPPPVCYQGILNPAAVTKILSARRAREQQAFQTKLARLLHSERAKASEPQKKPVENAPEFKIKQHPPKQLILEGQMLPLPPDMQKLVAAIVQDQGGLPEHYLLSGRSVSDSEQVAPPLSNAPETPVFTYPEWDYRRKNYHKNHCFLREVEIIPQTDDFIDKTLFQYRGLLKNLRQVFESLRGDNCWLKRQTDGEEIDIDALIMARVDALHSGEMSQQVFAKWHQQQRSVAVMFMVDMSGSTKGWINLAERESLVLLCEVLETLGDAYAIYGFSGSTRKRCEVYPIKRFNEAYNTEIKQRISGIQAQAYTRMGVTIRHLSQILQKTEAKIKLLITFSDGKPDDEGDNYRGYYGIEDTRQALLEAKRDGIYPFCITIDKTAKSYLPHLYGAVNYTVIDRVEQLPLKIFDIYRKLTT